MDANLDIADFYRRDLALLGRTKPVLLTGTTGPAVIVMHEVYGFTPTLARFCRWVRDAGFRIYAPILFGSPDTSNAEKKRWDASSHYACYVSSRSFWRTNPAR